MMGLVTAPSEQCSEAPPAAELIDGFVWGVLPDEILSRIFSLASVRTFSESGAFSVLPASLVCKAFARAASLPQEGGAIRLSSLRLGHQAPPECHAETDAPSPPSEPPSDSSDSPSDSPLCWPDLLRRVARLRPDALVLEDCNVFSGELAAALSPSCLPLSLLAIHRCHSAVGALRALLGCDEGDVDGGAAGGGGGGRRPRHTCPPVRDALLLTGWSDPIPPELPVGDLLCHLSLLCLCDTVLRADWVLSALPHLTCLRALFLGGAVFTGVAEGLKQSGGELAPWRAYGEQEPCGCCCCRYSGGCCCGGGGGGDESGAALRDASGERTCAPLGFSGCGGCERTCAPFGLSGCGGCERNCAPLGCASCGGCHGCGQAYCIGSRRSRARGESASRLSLIEVTFHEDSLLVPELRAVFPGAAVLDLSRAAPASLRRLRERVGDLVTAGHAQLAVDLAVAAAAQALILNYY